MRVGDVVRARVTDVGDFGIYLEHADRVGFVQVTELVWHPRGAAPRALVSRGDEVEVRIIGLDTARFSASIRQVHPELCPWRDAPTRWATGTQHVAKVIGVRAWGVVVELVSGVEGVVMHSPTGPAPDLGDELRLVVTRLEPGDPPRIELRADST